MIFAVRKQSIMNLFLVLIFSIMLTPLTIYAEPTIGTQTSIAQIGTPIEIIIPVEKSHTSGTVGYSINFASNEFESPDAPNSDDTDTQLDFMQQQITFMDNFHEKAVYRDSIKYDNLTDTDLPKFFNFTHVPLTKGQMYLITYNHRGDSEENDRVDYWEGFVVVEKYSKAVDQNGACKNPDLITVIKPSYSSVICVTSSTSQQLHDRWLS